ncbi:MAG: NADH-quinone oxidoreductase subunit N, partial [Rhodospirillales bacterium]|nr:NADH-quinone oxidoreductase subunit N [Rhodospirillales bacterium]
MTNLYPLLPALFLGIGGMVLLLGGVLTKAGDTTPGVTFGAIALLAVAAVLSLMAPDSLLFGGLLKTSLFTRYADTLVYLSAIAALILSVDYNKREGIARFEYPILVLFAVLGMIVMISAADMMSLYIGFELQSLALYICAAMARDSVRSTEAGLKYFVLGALA